MEISPRPVVAVVATLAVAAASATWAQQPEPLRLSSPPAHVLSSAEPLPQAPAQVQTQTAQGELLDVDGKASTLTIKTQTGEMAFRYTDQTKVTGAQKGVSGLATMTGSQVTVMFRRDGQLNVATSVDVKADTK